MATDIDHRTEKRIRTKQTLRILLFAVVAGILLLWAFANTDEVAVDWLVDTTTGPLIVVIAISAALGFLLGAVATWRQGR
jgi:uncharacterized integral membrane protein